MPGSTLACATTDASRAARASAPAWRRAAARALATPGGTAGVALTAALGVLAVLAPAIAPVDPFASVGVPLTPPTAAHPLGTDDLGRDLLAGVVHGARTSLLVVVVVMGWRRSSASPWARSRGTGAESRTTC